MYVSILARWGMFSVFGLWNEFSAVSLYNSCSVLLHFWPRHGFSLYPSQLICLPTSHILLCSLVLTSQVHLTCLPLSIDFPFSNQSFTHPVSVEVMYWNAILIFWNFELKNECWSLLLFNFWDTLQLRGSINIDSINIENSAFLLRVGRDFRDNLGCPTLIFKWRSAMERDYATRSGPTISNGRAVMIT